MSVPAATRAASASWASHGACLDSDPDLFFPIAPSGPALQQAAQAKAICAHCPVRLDCLSYALDTGQDAGVWGGTTEEERRQIRTERISRGSRPGAGSTDWPRRAR
jgi:WhiB family transcriptional regulator, redox-sensing transcriptional regulator